MSGTPTTLITRAMSAIVLAHDKILYTSEEDSRLPLVIMQALPASYCLSLSV